MDLNFKFMVWFGHPLFYPSQLKLENHWIYFPLFHLLIPILLGFHLLVTISQIIYVEGRNEPGTYIVDTIQDFLCELGMTPCMQV